MQEFTILLAQPDPTAQSPAPVQSDLNILNTYLVYSTNDEVELVNDLNVRNFLDDPNNADIANGLLVYLQNNTTDLEFEEIVYDNKKLAEILNDFYNSTVRQDQSPDTTLIQNATTNTKEILFTPNVFLPDNTRSIEQRVTLVEFSSDDSFYIDVFLQKNNITTSPLDFSEFTRDCVEDGILFTQCFVDLNKKDDPFEKFPEPGSATRGRRRRGGGFFGLGV